MTNYIKNPMICAVLILATFVAVTSFASASQVTGTLSSGSSSDSTISGTTGSGSSVSGTIGGGNGPISGSLATGGGGNGPIVGNVGSENEVTMSSSNPPIISLVSPGTINISNGSQLTGGEIALVNAPLVASNNPNPNPNANQLAAVVGSGVYLGAWYWWVLILLLLGVLGSYQYSRYKGRQYRKKVLIK